MIQLAPIGLTMLALVSLAQSGGALVGQRLDGMRRVCSYEDRVRGRLAPRLEITVGMAEPCPFYNPGLRRPRPAEIPAMATLEGQSRENGRTICRYSYLGVRYSRQIGAGRYCTYTPNLAD